MPFNIPLGGGCKTARCVCPEKLNIPLKADLVLLSQHWTELVSQEATGAQGPPPLCPLSFDDGDAKQSLENVMKQGETEDQIEILRNVIGIGSDGWVSNEGYEEAKAKAAEMKAQAIEDADDDFEREMTVRHWPFDDHDENERVEIEPRWTVKVLLDSAVRALCSLSQGFGKIPNQTFLGLDLGLSTQTWWITREGK